MMGIDEMAWIIVLPAYTVVIIFINQFSIILKIMYVCMISKLYM